MAKPVRPVAPPRALRSNPATFSANAEGEITYQFDTLPTWMDTLGDFVDLKADEANAAALVGAAIPVPEKSGQALIVNAAGDGLAYAGFLAGFRNAIINGNFDTWQRGTSGTTGYVSDRWIHNVAGPSGAVTQSRQDFTVGQTDVPNEPEYFYRIQGSSYTFDAANVIQRIEDVRTFAGQTVTVSFHARASASRELGLRFFQLFDGSANVETLASPVSLTASWQKFTATVSIPSIAGKTVGPSSRLELAFDIKQGAVGSNLNNDSIDIAQVQLEAGSVATPFERRPVGTELALCQRYYTKGLGEGQVGYSPVSSAGINQRRFFVQFPTTMRAIPAIAGAQAFSIGPLVADTVSVNSLKLFGTAGADIECVLFATMELDAEL